MRAWLIIGAAALVLLVGLGWWRTHRELRVYAVAGGPTDIYVDDRGPMHPAHGLLLARAEAGRHVIKAITHATGETASLTVFLKDTERTPAYGHSWWCATIYRDRPGGPLKMELQSRANCAQALRLEWGFTEWEHEVLGR